MTHNPGKKAPTEADNKKTDTGLKGNIRHNGEKYGNRRIGREMIFCNFCFKKVTWKF